MKHLSLTKILKVQLKQYSTVETSTGTYILKTPFMSSSSPVLANWVCFRQDWGTFSIHCAVGTALCCFVCVVMAILLRAPMYACLASWIFQQSDWCSKRLGSNHDNRRSTSVSERLIGMLAIWSCIPFLCFCSSLLLCLQVCKEKTSNVLIINCTSCFLLEIAQWVSLTCTFQISPDRLIPESLPKLFLFDKLCRL